jgi:hypothetical protein
LISNADDEEDDDDDFDDDDDDDDEVIFCPLLTFTVPSTPSSPSSSAFSIGVGDAKDVTLDLWGDDKGDFRE